MRSVHAEIIDKGLFTHRQAEIVKLMAEGVSDKDIARKLDISIRTVGAHMSAIYEKLDLKCSSINNRVTAVIMLIARGTVRLSLYSLVALLVGASVQLDEAGVRSARVRTPSARSRRFD
jgi:DNA-binding CsgD family transcriptional regulator